jgi:adenine-specific DNA methylase
MSDRPQVLIEKWLPIDIIGAESLRDASAAQKPPLNRLHVWWARRPLTASRAAILTSVLPVWSESWPEHLRKKFPSEESYKDWFLRLCGIFGDPVAGRKLIAWAKERNIKLEESPYSHKRAFTVSPSSQYLDTLADLLEHTWGTRTLSVLDPFAGGGSIPFEAVRYGFKTYANELNPVASVILKATLEYPAKFGVGLVDDLLKYGKMLTDKVRKQLEPFFPVDKAESVHAYVWARTVRCPYTGKTIPLSPNWWLQKGTDPVVAKPVFCPDASEASFEIVLGETACHGVKPDEGTVKGGNAVSPWAHNQVVSGEYIKAEAQAGRLGQQLYALAVKKSRNLSFRAPGDQDLKAVSFAEVELKKKLPRWEAKGWVPCEPYPDQSNDLRPLHYGMPTWGRFFSPRQLLSLGTFIELFRELKSIISMELAKDRADAVATYLSFLLTKSVNYNSYLASWHAPRQVMRSVFDRHDFSFKWTFGEFDSSRNLFQWALEQILDAYRGVAELVSPPQTTYHLSADRQSVHLIHGNATDLAGIETASINHICADPPYYDNVMYAELADFFYVWMKRTLGDVYPELFADELTNKDDEAVANVARFAAMGRKKKELAAADYERKMAAAFREMHRVLRDDGVLTVMFTHKKAEAWDTLATSLIGAGFTIRSSWPVHTESEHSLHQAKKNAAQSTIFLTCRKRSPSSEPVWWDDIKGQVRRVAREKAEEFEKQGIRGVDLYIATFGPTLAIISESWPVLTSEVDERTGEPKPLRPEVALDLAREEVVALRKQGLLLGRSVQFDSYTDWYLMAWDAFQAEEFPGDEARKLALALGIDLEREIISQKRLVTKKSRNVVLQLPVARRKKDLVDPDSETFDCWIDAVHTAMLLYQEDGAPACQNFLRQRGFLTDNTIKACIQALINAVPRTKQKGKFVRKEAEILEAMRLAFFDDLQAPPESEPPKVAVQLGLFDEVNPDVFDDEFDEDN